MHEPDSIFTHFEKLYKELKAEQDLWSDCEDYFLTFMIKKDFQEAWIRLQSDYSIEFRTYVNECLGFDKELKTKFLAA